jgi:hypothetical protein
MISPKDERLNFKEKGAAFSSPHRNKLELIVVFLIICSGKTAPEKRMKDKELLKIPKQVRRRSAPRAPALCGLIPPPYRASRRPCSSAPTTPWAPPTTSCSTPTSSTSGALLRARAFRAKFTPEQHPEQAGRDAGSHGLPVR